MSDYPKIIQQPYFVDNRGFLSVALNSELMKANNFYFILKLIKPGYSKISHTLRGYYLHLSSYAQTKLVYFLHGSVFNVVLNWTRSDDEQCHNR